MKIRLAKSPLFVVFFCGFMLFANACKAQFYSVKTNLLEVGMLGTMNVDLSMMVAPQWTVNLDVAFNPWTYNNNLKLKHWLVEPGARYWFWQTYTGSFLSMYGMGARFNGGFKKRYDGYGFGVGATYGYAWAVGKRWNIEAEAGVGLFWSRHSVNECKNCGAVITPTKTYLSPSPKGAVSIVYLF